MRTTIAVMLGIIIVSPTAALAAVAIIGNLFAFVSVAWPWLLGIMAFGLLFGLQEANDISERARAYRAAFDEEQERRAEIWARTRVTSLLDPAFIPGRSLVAAGTVTHRRRARRNTPAAAPPRPPLRPFTITADHAPLPTGGPYAQVLRAAATPRLR